MPFEIGWRTPGVLQFDFSGDVTGLELVDCITKSEQFLAETVNSPVCVWVAVNNVRKIPGNVFQVLLKTGGLQNVPRGLIVIGATSYLIMVVRLAALTFWGLDFKPIFVSNNEEGQSALREMLRAATY